MKPQLIKFFIIFVFLLVFAGTAGAYFGLGQPAGFVNDIAGVLTTEQEQVLESKLSQFEKDSSNEVVVVIIKDLQGDTIENFAEKLFKDWGIGKKGKDNGVLILIARDNREMRIEVGYGLEGVLTDAQSSWVINKIMRPAFQNDDFYKGLNDATDKIITAAKGEILPSMDNNTKQGSSFDWEIIIWLGLFGVMWLSAILARSKSWWLGGVLGGMIGVILGLIKGFFNFGFVSIAILLPVGLLFDYIVSKQYKKGKSRGHVPWWVGGGRWGGGSSGGFGGFGGGMSGGGGSSGRW